MRDLLLAAALLCPAAAARAQEGDRFVWTQLRHAGSWDAYPGAHAEVLRFVGSVTSVLSLPERRLVTLGDAQLAGSPFLVLSGRRPPPPLDEEELRRLRDYLTSGGLLWIDDAAGQASSPFDRWVRRTLKAVFPDAELSPLPPDHVLYKTFFLLRSIGGRAIVSNAVEGVSWGGKAVVVYTRNDLLGAWAKDALGNPLFECAPGGEPQRLEAKKLTLNIVLYALTGNYKSDAVHQPYILQKLRAGTP